MIHFDVASLEPLVLAEKTTNKLFTVQKNNKKYLIKTYSGDNKALRRQAEYQRLSLWIDHSFPVPKPYDASINFEDNTPYLALEYIEGVTLKSFLQDKAISLDKKNHALSNIFKANAIRHKLSIHNGDQRLIHHDLNSGNILIKGASFFYIDFEGSFSGENSKHDLQDNISIEVAKLVRWSAMDMGKSQLSKILELMVNEYKGTEIPNSIINRIYNRPFQFVHRWKDKKKKSKKPNEVTKYDIADSLTKIINTP